LILSQQTYETQLKQIAEYIGSNLIDIVTLSQTIPGDQFIIKTIEIPYSINENLYDLSLIKTPTSRVDVEVVRLISIIVKYNQYSIVDMPWSGDNILIYTNQTIPRSDVLISNSISSNAAASQTAIRKEPNKIIVWCLKTDDVIVIGFGVMDKN
jgi:hypothetical protein